MTVARSPSADEAVSDLTTIRAAAPSGRRSRLWPSTTPPGRGRRPDRSWAEGVLTVGWIVVGLIVVVAAGDLIRSDWAPATDASLVAAMVVDSVSLDPPLVGMPTSLGIEGGAPLSHPGPLGLWILAIPTKVLGEPGHGLVVGSAALAVLSLAAIAVLLRRWRDAVLEAVGLGVVAAMVISVGGGTFANPFNPYVGILPLLLCILAAAGVLAGRHRQLWVMVLSGSLAAQTHLGYGVLVGALVAVVAVSLVVDAVRGSARVRHRLVRRIVPVGVGLGLVAWIGPIVDQIAGTSNLSRLLTSQSRDRAALGLSHGVDLAVEMTSVPPRWLIDRARDQDLSDPGGVRVALSLATLALLAGLLVWAVRRRDRVLASLAVVTVISLVAAVATSARVVDPTDTPYFVVENAVLYRLFWWPVGAVFALTVSWGTVRLLSLALRGRSTEVHLVRAGRPLLAGLVAAIPIVAVAAYTGPPAALQGFLGRESANAAAIADLPGSPETVVLRLAPEVAAAPDVSAGGLPPDVWDLGPHQVYGHAANLVAQLRLRGVTVRFADEPDGGIIFMRAYRDDHRARGGETEVLFLAGPDVHEAPPAGYRRVSWTGSGPGEPIDVLRVPTGVFVRTGADEAASTSSSPRASLAARGAAGP